MLDNFFGWRNKKKKDCLKTANISFLLQYELQNLYRKKINIFFFVGKK